MPWTLDQDDVDLPSALARVGELRTRVHAVHVQRADGAYDVLVEVDDQGTARPPAPLRPGVQLVASNRPLAVH